MRAAITVGPRDIQICDVPAPPTVHPGHVRLAPTTVGICGSDLHFYEGDDAALSGAPRTFPRIQGHEIGAVVLADPSDRLPVGGTVAVWPLMPCGENCHMCARSRPNVCSSMSIIGVHTDGGFAEEIVVPAEHVFPVGEVPGKVAAFAEPTSVALHALERAAPEPGDAVLVLGGGAIGQAACLVLADQGIETVLVDPVPGRAEAAALWGVVGCTDTADARARLLRRTDGVGPDIVVEATGVPTVLDSAVDLVRVGGVVVTAGLTSGKGPLHQGRIPAKELTVVGASCCIGSEFRAAADIVHRWADTVEQLPMRAYGLDESAAAIAAAGRATDVVKAFVELPPPGRKET